MALTEKQKKFCECYVSSGNATQSAIKAGYSKKSAKQIGQKLLTKVDLKKYIQELNEEIKNEKILDAVKMQEILTSIILQKSEEEVIVVEGCGDGVTEAVKKKKTASQKDRIKAIQLLAKMQGILDNTTNVNLTLPVFGGEDELE